MWLTQEKDIHITYTLPLLTLLKFNLFYMLSFSFVKEIDYWIMED